MQAIVDEYNMKGWNQQDTLKDINKSIQDDISEDSSGNIGQSQVEKFKQDFRSANITAKDIFLPPFLEYPEGTSNEAIENKRYELITQQMTGPNAGGIREE